VDVAAVCKAPIPQLDWQSLLTMQGSTWEDLLSMDDEDLTTLEVDFMAPSEHPYMVQVQSCMRVLEERLRWRVQEHMDSSQSVHVAKKPMRKMSTTSLTGHANREIRRLDMRTYSTVVWSKSEQEQIAKLSSRVLEFLGAVVVAFQEDPRALKLLEVFVYKMERRFHGVYQACVKDILSMQPGFVRAIGMARMLSSEAEKSQECKMRLAGTIGPADLGRNIWSGLMQSAVRTQEAVIVYTKSVADVTGAHINRTSIKRLYRILEKMALDPKFTSGGESRAWDTARMMLAYDTMEGMASGVEQLLKDHRCGRVHVLRVKERFSEPTSGGWSDILVNLRFPPEQATLSQLPFELQLAHTQMMVIRKEMGGHHGYAKYRSAKEILEVVSSGTDIENFMGVAMSHKAMTIQDSMSDRKDMKDVMSNSQDSIDNLTGVLPGEVGILPAKTPEEV